MSSSSSSKNRYLHHSVSSSAFNKKLFTNLGRAYRPVKRLGRQESVIFGGASRKSAAVGTSRRSSILASSSSLPSSRSSFVPSTVPHHRNVRVDDRSAQSTGRSTPSSVPPRFVGWRNYVNLLNLTDGLKHQLPNFGYELYIPFVERLLFDSIESSSSFDHLVSRQSNSSSGSLTIRCPDALQSTTQQMRASGVVFTSSSSSSSCSSTAVVVDHHRSPFAPLPLNIVLGDFTVGNTLSEVHRRDWTALYKQALLPVLKILCAGYRDQFRPMTKNYLTSTFVLNRHAKRWDMLLNQMCETSNVVMNHEGENAFGRSHFADGFSFGVLREETEEEYNDEDDVNNNNNNNNNNDDDITVAGGDVRLTTRTNFTRGDPCGDPLLGRNNCSRSAKNTSRDSSSLLIKFFTDLRNSASASFAATTSASSSVSSSSSLSTATSATGAFSASLSSSRSHTSKIGGGTLSSGVRAEEIRALLEQMTPTVGDLSSNGPCACCLMSPVVLVRAPLLEDSQRMHRFASSCVSVIFSLNASTFLCGHMPPNMFAENFSLKHVLRSNLEEGVDHDVAKTVYVSSLTYYERLFALQYVIAVVVDWCWTRHRLTHAVLQGNNCNYDSVPPVTLVMDQCLFDIIEQVPTVCLQSLARERKYVCHVVT